MIEELTLEMIKTMAERRGLTLPQEELQRLLPGVTRARRQAAELRDLLTPSDEPAAGFIARKNDGV
jgi:hypothetical protein